MFESGYEVVGLMCAIVDCGPHAGGRSAHGGAQKLEEVEISKLEVVIFHDGGHG